MKLQQQSVLYGEVLNRCDGLGNVAFYAVLDNVSHDGTRDLLIDYSEREPRLHLIWAPENQCIVDAYVRGYREALSRSHDFVLEIDAGFSHRPADIPKFLEAMEAGYDCVFGSRVISGGAIRDTPLFRRVVSRGGSLLTNMLVGTHLTDMTSGFQLFSRDALEMVLARGIRSRAHFFQTEMKFHCRKLTIKEVPILYASGSAGVDSGVLLDAFRNLLHLCVLRWRGR